MPVSKKRKKAEVKTRNQRFRREARERQARGNLARLTNMVEYIEKAEYKIKEAEQDVPDNLADMR